MRMKDALTKRNELKARKPAFLAQDTHKKKRIRQRWKRPRGLQSKVRLHKRGYRRGVSSGWRSPKAARGLSREGLIPVRVENLSQLESLDPKTQGALVSGRVSIRTKKALYDAANQRSITILNRDAKVFEERYATKMAEREARKKLIEDRRKRQEKLKKDIEETQKSGVAAEGLKEPKKESAKETDAPTPAEKPAEKGASAPESGTSEPSEATREDSAPKPAAPKTPERSSKKDEEPNASEDTSKEGSR